MIARFWFIFWLLSITSSQAQHPHYRTFTTDDGLPDDILYTPFQDSRGYIWATSAQGIARYNGQRFQRFTTAQGLLRNEITGLFEDKHGRIFFQMLLTSDFRLQYFDTRTEQIQTLQLPRQHILLKQTGIRKGQQTRLPLVYQQLEGDTMLVSLLHSFVPNQAHFFALLHCSDKGVRVLPASPKLLPPPLTDTQDLLAVDNTCNHPTIWQRWHGGWRRFATVPKVTPVGITYNHVRILTDSTVLFTDTQEISIINRQGKRLYTYPIRRNRFAEFAMYQGVSCIPQTDGRFVFLDQQLRPLPFSGFLNTLPLKSIYIDRQKNWWIITTNNKLLFFSEAALTRSQTWLPGETIHHLARDTRGRVWAGTSTGKVTYQTQPGAAWQSVAFTPPFTDYIRGMASTPSGHLVVGNNEYLAYFNIDKPSLPARIMLPLGLRLPGTPTPFRITISGNGYFVAAVKSVTGANPLLISTSYGTTAWTMTKNQISIRPLVNNKVFSAVNYGGVLYVARPDGFYALRAGDGEPRRITALPAQSMAQVAVDSTGMLYVAPDDGRLYVFNPRTGKARLLSFFGDGKINRIVVTTDHTVWVCSQQKGLVKVVHQQPVKFIGLADGLPSLNVFDVLTGPNQLIVGTKAGVTFLDGQAGTTIQKHPTNLLVKSLTFPQDNRDSVWLYPDLNHPLRLKTNQNWLDIHLENLDFLAPGTAYTYTLLRDTDTVTVDRERQLTHKLHYLRPGQYHLHIADELGQSQTVRFEVLRPFWQQGWFWALLAGLVALGVAYQVRLRINRASMELRALQGQMNAHFAANFMEVVKNLVLREDKRRAFDVLAMFANLMRRFVMASRHKKITVYEEVEFLKQYIQLSKLVYYLRPTEKVNKTLTYFVVIEDGVDPNAFIRPLLLQPLVENAIKYGIFHKESPSQLLIRFTPCTARTIKCIIEDDGIGRQQMETLKTQENEAIQSLGMQLPPPVKGSIEAMRDAGVLVSITDLPQGTCVEVILNLITA